MRRVAFRLMDFQCFQEVNSSEDLSRLLSGFCESQIVERCGTVSRRESLRKKSCSLLCMPCDVNVNEQWHEFRKFTE